MENKYEKAKTREDSIGNAMGESVCASLRMGSCANSNGGEKGIHVSQTHIGEVWEDFHAEWDKMQNPSKESLVKLAIVWEAPIAGQPMRIKTDANTTWADGLMVRTVTVIGTGMWLVSDEEGNCYVMQSNHVNIHDEKFDMFIGKCYGSVCEGNLFVDRVAPVDVFYNRNDDAWVDCHFNWMKINRVDDVPGAPGLKRLTVTITKNGRQIKVLVTK